MERLVVYHSSIACCRPILIFMSAPDPGICYGEGGSFTRGCLNGKGGGGQSAYGYIPKLGGLQSAS